MNPLQLAAINISGGLNSLRGIVVAAIVVVVGFLAVGKLFSGRVIALVIVLLLGCLAYGAAAGNVVGDLWDTTKGLFGFS